MPGVIPPYPVLPAVVALVLAVGGRSEGRAPAQPEEPTGARPVVDLQRMTPFSGFAKTAARDNVAGVIVNDQLRSYPGYNLYTVEMRSMAELVDQAGTVVRRWHQPSSHRWERAELLPNGDLIVVGVNAFEPPDEGIPDAARYIIRLGFNGEVKWKRKMTAHNGVERTPRGQLLVLTYRRQRIPDVNPDIDTRDDRLSLLDPEGQVLSVRSLLEIIKTNPQAFPLQPVKPDGPDDRQWVDLLHTNSVEWMPYEELVGTHPLYAKSHVLVCARNQNRVAVINWDNGQLIWSWGLGILSRPHDAHWLKNGHLLIFDNGTKRGWSRVVELDPITEKILWEYRASVKEEFYTQRNGSSQRLRNGSTLITNSDNGQAFEVTSDGRLVWMFLCPYTDRQGRRAALVRMTRYEKTLVDSFIARSIREAKKQTPQKTPSLIEGPNRAK